MNEMQPIRACAQCELEHGILDRSDPSKTHGDCRRHIIDRLLKGGYSREQVEEFVNTLSPGAFCPDLGPVGESAEVIVARLLEDEALVRVCSTCENEFGQLQVPPGHQKSHGYCKRHMLRFIDDSVRAGVFAPEKARAMRQKYAARPESDFPPDRANMRM